MWARGRKTVRRVAPQAQSLAEQKARPVPPAAPAKTAPLPAPEAGASAMNSMIALGSVGADVDIQIPEFAKDAVSISLDGRLDEGVWDQVPGYDNMLVMDPDTLADTRFKTDARFFYTEEGLYIGVYMQQPKDTLIARLSSRDEFINRDSCLLYTSPSPRD